MSEHMPSKDRLPLIEWVLERFENCVRIAKTKEAPADRDGWLEDAAYFREILVILNAQPVPEPAQASKEIGARNVLWDHMHEQHELALLESELDEIIRLAVAAHEPCNELERYRSYEHIEAQHGETGRNWSGPRYKLPIGFHEISNESGVTDEEWQTRRASQPPPVAHSVRYDVNGWLCSVCHGWNDQRHTFCVHPHSAEQLSHPTKGGEQS